MKSNNDNKIWRYLKKGDIIMDSKTSCWGNLKFEIYDFHGNWYCPLVSSYIIGKNYSSGRRDMCNLDARYVRLIGAVNRPFFKLNKISLAKLIAKGNIEAKRELKIRINLKYS